MSLLPAQSTNNQSVAAADEDADALFAQARHLATQGEYTAASAYAALATAAFTAKAAKVTAPLPIYPGDHEPAPTPWCHTCRAPNSRLTPEGRPCPRCSTDHLRARICRYCSVYLEKRPVYGSDEPWRWTDDYNSRSCPQAPDPLDSPQSPAPEEDVWPENRWATFFERWYRLYGTEPVTGGELTRDLELRPFLPRTTYGEFHAAHLDRWFVARAETACSGYILSASAGDTTADDAPRWRVSRCQ